MFQSRQDYIDILQRMYKSLLSLRYKAGNFDLWFIVRIQSGFFFHHLYSGKITNDELKKSATILSPKLKTKYSLKQNSKKVYYFIRLKALEFQLKNRLENKTLFIGYKKHNIKNGQYNMYLHPFIKSDDNFIFYMDNLDNDPKVQKYYDYLLAFYELSPNTDFHNIKNISKEVLNFVNEKLDIDSSLLQKNIINTLNNSVIQQKVCSRFLSTLNPNQLFCYCYYSNLTNSFLYVANKLGIKTIEYQHSNITDTHFAFSKWENPDDSLLHFPKVFYVWEDSDKTLITNNFSGKKYIPNVEIVGNKYLNQSLQLSHENKNATANNILICLQGQWIPDFLEDFIKTDEKYSWYFRIHPRYPQDKEKLIKLKEEKKSKILIDEANNKELYDVFQDISILMTSFSGTALEAEKFGKQVIIFGEEGYNSYQDKIQNNVYAFIDNHQKIINVL